MPTKTLSDCDSLIIRESLMGQGKSDITCRSNSFEVGKLRDLPRSLCAMRVEIDF